MAFIRVDRKVVEKDVGGGAYITGSGFYPVTIKSASLSTSKDGYVSMNFNFDWNGNEKVIYGLGMFNKNGSEHFKLATLQSLMVILGIEELDDPVETEIKTKNGMTMIEAFEQLEGAEVIVQISQKFSRYEGKVRDGLEVKRFFDAETHATGAEIINDTEPGMQYDKLLPFAEKVIYEDGVTEEEALAHLVSKSSGGGSAPKAAAAAPKKSPFAKAKQ